METATEGPSSSFSGTCAECGSPIPADAFGDHCPLCLFTFTGQAEEEADALECFCSVTKRYPQFEFDEDRDDMAGADFAWRGRVLEEDTAVILRLRDAADNATAPLEECRRRSRIEDPQVAKMHACGEHGCFVYTIVSEPVGDRLSDAMREGRLSRPQMDWIYEKVREVWNRTF